MTYSRARKAIQCLAAAVPAMGLAVTLAAVTCLLAWAAGDFGAAQGLLWGLLVVAVLAVLALATSVALALGELFAQEIHLKRDAKD